MSKDRDDDDHLLTAKMRAAFIADDLRADFAERVTSAWLHERRGSARRRWWSRLPVVLGTFTMAIAAAVLLWLSATARQSATERARGHKPTAIASQRTGTREEQPKAKPLPAAASNAGQSYQPVSNLSIKTMPNVDADACLRSVEYPADAIKLGIEGDVTLRVELDETGHVHGARVLSGLGHGLDDAAIFALTHNCIFTPAIAKDGTPVAYVIPRFILHFEIPTASLRNESASRGNQSALDRDTVVKTMTAIRPNLDACYAKFRVAGVATINLTIAPNGGVTAKIAPRVGGWGDFSKDSPTGICIIDSVQKARFPSFEGLPQTISYPVVLGSESVMETLQRAQQAYVAGEYSDAIALAQRVKSEDPQRALRIIGASSCFLKDGRAATKAWRELSTPGRKFVEYVCGNNRVPIESQ
jgi:TonB family protein